MADTNEEKNNDPYKEIKDVFIFLASGAFAAFHKAFLAPSSETSLVDSEPSLVDILTGWIDPVHQVIHAYIHFSISIVLQIILLLWTVKLIIVVLKLLRKKR